MTPHEVEDVAIRVIEVTGVLDSRDLGLLFAMMLRAYAPSKADAVLLLKDVESALNMVALPWPGEQLQ